MTELEPELAERLARFLDGEMPDDECVRFECELAERFRGAGKIDEARAAIARAYQADAMSVRAGIIEGRLETDAGNAEAAVRAFERAARNDPEYLP